jgi:hypothetical protein
LYKLGADIRPLVFQLSFDFFNLGLNLLGEEVRFWDAGDRLHELGWVKVTANYIMYQHYCDAGLYDNMTDEQWAAVEKWKERWM